MSHTHSHNEGHIRVRISEKLETDVAGETLPEALEGVIMAGQQLRGVAVSLADTYRR